VNWKVGNFSVSKWGAFLATCLFIVIVSGYAALESDPSSFLPSIFTGVCSGVLILAVDKWLDRADLKFLTNRDHIVGSTKGREDARYYGELFDGARREVSFYGRTGYRLLTDFADIDSRDPNKRALLRALDRGVRVRFLVADNSCLDDRGRDDADLARKLFERVRLALPLSNFDLRFYSSPATFSYFRADETVVFGVNFPNKKSRHTPSVIATSASAAAASYIEFFEETWNSSGV
jgi:hypothetical protein